MRLLFIALFLSAINIATAQKIDSLFLDAAITKLQNSKEYTLKVAKVMPEEKYSFKPVPDEMSFVDGVHVRVFSAQRVKAASTLSV